MLTVACVLKSGGDYDWEYVWRLYKGVRKYLTIPYKFVCLTDVFVGYDYLVLGKIARGKIKIISLNDNLKGWWSKIELFKLKGEVLYFDLDTIILKNLDLFVETFRTANLISSNRDNIYMLEAFRTVGEGNDWTSGIMMWDGDFSWIHSNFRKEHIPSTYRGWDHLYIKEELKPRTRINSVNLCLSKGKIVSYKKHCRDRVPEKAAIICFHGRPRPKETELWNEN